MHRGRGIGGGPSSGVVQGVIAGYKGCGDNGREALIPAMLASAFTLMIVLMKAGAHRRTKQRSPPARLGLV